MIKTISRIADTSQFLQSVESVLEEKSIVAATDIDGNYIYANDNFCTLSGYSREELYGSACSLLNSDIHPSGFYEAIHAHIMSGDIWQGEISSRSKHGEIFWSDAIIIPLKRSDDIRGFLLLLYNITPRKNLETELGKLAESKGQLETLYRDIAEAMPAGVAVFGEDDEIVFSNSRYHDIGDLKRAATESSVVVDFKQARDRAVGKSEHVPSDVYESGSGDQWIRHNTQTFSTGRRIELRQDVTELVQLRRQLQEQADRDPLTGVYNRSAVPGMLAGAISRCAAAGREGAFLVVELDGFRHINLNMGHVTGDLLLKELVKRMEEASTPREAIVRLGDDEFAVVMEDIGSPSGMEGRVLEFIVHLQQPLKIRKHLIVPVIRAGAVMFPSQASTAKSVHLKADLALQAAKSADGPAFRVFDEKIQKAFEEKRTMRFAMHEAIVTGEISIALQPQYRLDKLEYSGFEALARWKQEGEYVSPASFIPIAEETQLIIPLGDAVLQKTLAAVQNMKRMGLSPGIAAINIAVDQLRQADFYETIMYMLSRYNLNADELQLEITENAFLDRHDELTLSTLNRFREAGVSIALDDFGTGYATLSHLKSFPIDVIKIDRSFVQEIETSAQSATIVRELIKLAHNLGLTVVAEGIERPRQLEMLKEYDCDLGQGFLFSRPLTDTQFLDLF